MSKQAETYIKDWLATTRIPQTCERRRVLDVLAKAHLAGPLRIETVKVSNETGIGRMAVWLSILDLHLRGALQARNVGGLMTIDFPFDFPNDHPAYVHVSPDKAQEAAE